MGLNLDYIKGQTPLDEDEKEGLKIPTIATRAELDEFEQHNIEEAVLWLLEQSFDPGEAFTREMVCKLHLKMFGVVWDWAGTFRKTNKNLGVDKWEIETSLKTLNDDALHWVENQVYLPDELAVRYKHRLVSIHCFPNGNGRHSRLMADLIISKIFQRDMFSWGSQHLGAPGESRDLYLKSLRKADQGNIRPLLEFARM